MSDQPPPPHQQQQQQQHQNRQQGGGGLSYSHPRQRHRGRGNAGRGRHVAGEWSNPSTSSAAARGARGGGRTGFSSTNFRHQNTSQDSYGMESSGYQAVSQQYTSRHYQGRGRGRGRQNHYNHQRNTNPTSVSTGTINQIPLPSQVVTSRSTPSASPLLSNYYINNTNNNTINNISYPPYWDAALCMLKYSVRDGNLIRGKLRVLPGSKDSSMAFVACDRGSLARDVLIATALDRNRALDGDTVYVEVFPAPSQLQDASSPSTREQVEGEANSCNAKGENVETIQSDLRNLSLNNHQNVNNKGTDDDGGGDIIVMQHEDDDGSDIILNVENWQDDPIQMQLWNPIVTVPKPKNLSSAAAAVSSSVESTDNDNNNTDSKITTGQQRRGRVVYVIPPKSFAMQPSEINPSLKTPSKHDAPHKRTIVGRLHLLKRQSGDFYLLIPTNRSLPEFKCHTNTIITPNVDNPNVAYKSEYIYGSWKENFKWPPCVNVQPLVGDIGGSYSSIVEMETAALLPTYGVDHGDFPPAVLHDVDCVVKSGLYYNQATTGGDNANDENDGDMEWKPTPDMLVGRRDYRQQRIFTIDPTTARDLDDALHIRELSDGRIEIGVHIADVAYFVQPDSEVDKEAERRATTVYLVDRVIPMLPRPLCEIACSLNENVERLAFSCVWTMYPDGTLTKPNKKQDVWYGRTVIKSCARLDYATAQNIIDGKVAIGESEVDMDESLWPKSRRPTGGHTVDDVAADVRLMHKVAMARRRLRFQNGALALNGIKLTFQLESDGESPMLCAPYMIRDSNRLVEEYMLLANYLVAQRLVTHAGGLAVLRHHSPPIMDGIEKVVDLAKIAMGFDIDVSSSKELQKSLNRLGRECHDEIVLQCITALLTSPMQQALYFVVGETDREQWHHFALHIPFYTHFTSPIRRYPDVLVHRLLQATIDGEEALKAFPLDVNTLNQICDHCNEKKEASRSAQERGDTVFLALYLKRFPLKSQVGVVLSVGVKTFAIFIPSLGLNTKVFLDEQDKNIFAFTSYEEKGDKRIKVESKGQGSGTNGSSWESFQIKVFAKLRVACVCKDKFPIDVKVMIEGPWEPETSSSV